MPAAGGLDPNLANALGNLHPDHFNAIKQLAATDLAGPADKDRFSGGQPGSDWNFGGPGYSSPQSMVQGGWSPMSPPSGPSGPSNRAESPTSDEMVMAGPHASGLPGMARDITPGSQPLGVPGMPQPSIQQNPLAGLRPPGSPDTAINRHGGVLHGMPVHAQPVNEPAPAPVAGAMRPGMNDFNLLHGGLPSRDQQKPIPLTPQEQANNAGLAPGQFFNVPNSTGAWGSPINNTPAAGPTQWSAANQQKLAGLAAANQQKLAGLPGGMSTARAANIDSANARMHQLQNQHDAAFALTRLGLPGPVAHGVAFGAIDPQQANDILQHQRDLQMAVAERGIGQRGVQAQGGLLRPQLWQNQLAERQMARTKIRMDAAAQGKGAEAEAQIQAAGLGEEDDPKNIAAVHPFVNGGGLVDPQETQIKPAQLKEGARQEVERGQKREAARENRAEWSGFGFPGINQGEGAVQQKQPGLPTPQQPMTAWDRFLNKLAFPGIGG